MPALWETLLSHLPAASPLRSTLGQRAQAGLLLADLLADRVARAHAAWPDISVDDDRFLAHLARVLATEDPPSLEEIHIEDLYLACGCLHGDKQALRVFEHQIMPAADHALRRLDHTGTLVDEAKQRLREKLLVHDGEKPPRIGSFSGRGDLVGFIKVAATRQGLDVLRREKKDEPNADDELLDHLAFAGDDQEAQHIKTRTRVAFRAAFQQALSSLSARERLMLRQSALDGLSIDELSGIYGVHRATVARWLQKTRELLLERTQEALRERLEIDQAQLPAVFSLIKSQLDVSLPRLLHVDD